MINFAHNLLQSKNIKKPNSNFALEHNELLLKAYVHYFLSNSYFLPNDSPSKTMKNVFLFHLKSPFRSQHIPIFVFLSSPLFLPVRHCFRG